MLSTSHRFLFVHIPKTAGNSVQTVLSEYADDRIVRQFTQDGVERFKVRSDRFSTRKHSTLAEYRRAYGEELYGRLFKFACVRDPWQRAMSYYFSPHAERGSWDRAEFVASLELLRPVADFFSVDEAQPLAEAVRNVDFLMRFETLEADFRAVCERIGIPFQPLPVRNRSGRADHRRYYDAETREIVAERYREEIELFGYKFE